MGVQISVLCTPLISEWDKRDGFRSPGTPVLALTLLYKLIATDGLETQECVCCSLINYFEFETMAKKKSKFLTKQNQQWHCINAEFWYLTVVIFLLHRRLFFFWFLHSQLIPHSASHYASSHGQQSILTFIFSTITPIFVLLWASNLERDYES